jgi:hypothetical protein
MRAKLIRRRHSKNFFSPLCQNDLISVHVSALHSTQQGQIILNQPLQRQNVNKAGRGRVFDDVKQVTAGLGVD